MPRNPDPNSLASRIRGLLQRDPGVAYSVSDIAETLGEDPRRVGNNIGTLVTRGNLERTASGSYLFNGDVEPDASDEPSSPIASLEPDDEPDEDGVDEVLSYLTTLEDGQLIYQGESGQFYSVEAVALEAVTP